MKAYAALILLIVIGIVLSAVGMTADLPYSRVSTEVEQVNFALKFGSGDFNPHYFIHPPFFAYVLFLFYGFFFIMGKILFFFKSVSDFELLYFRDPAVFYVIARFIVLFLFGAGVYLLFKIAKGLLDKRTALLACIFMVFSPVFIISSHYASSDIPMFFVSLCSFYFIYRVLYYGETRDYFWAAILVGLAAATKYNAVTLVVPLVAAHLLRTDKKRLIKRIFDKKLALVFLVIILGFILGCPFSVLDYKGFLAQVFRQVGRMASKTYHFASWRADKPGWAYILTNAWPFGLSWPITILSILSIFYALYRHKREDILLLSFILASYALAGNWGIIKDRHYLHIYPFMFILSAQFIVDLFAKIKISQKRRLLLTSAVLIPLLLPAVIRIIKFDNLVCRKALVLEAKSWIENNIPADSKIAAMTGVALVSNKDSILRKLKERNIGPQ